MKYPFGTRILFPCAALLLLMHLTGCSVFHTKSAGLEIHLQSIFNGEHVRVEVDGRAVFDGIAESDYFGNAAEIIRLEQRAGMHRIRVEVEGSVSAEQRFVLEDELFIGVRYFPEPLHELVDLYGVVIELSETPYLYY